MSRLWFLIAHTNFVLSLPLLIVGAFFATIAFALLSVPAVHVLNGLKRLVVG